MTQCCGCLEGRLSGLASTTTMTLGNLGILTQKTPTFSVFLLILSGRIVYKIP